MSQKLNSFKNDTLITALTTLNGLLAELRVLLIMMKIYRISH